MGFFMVLGATAFDSSLVEKANKATASPTSRGGLRRFHDRKVGSEY